MMRDALSAMALVALGLVLVCVGTILGAITGAITGAIVGFFFEGAISNTLRGFGVTPTFTMWELGATLGFVSGFFKCTVRK